MKELDEWNKLIEEDSDCAKDSIIKTCSLHGAKHFIGVQYSRCNNRNLCPRCAWFYAQREASLTYDYFTHNLGRRLKFPLMWTHRVLTLPLELNDMSNKELSKAVHRYMQNDLKGAITQTEYQELKHKLDQHKHLIRPEAYKLALEKLEFKMKMGMAGGIRRGYMYAIQEQSSSNPLEKHKHVHLLTPNVGIIQHEKPKKADPRRLACPYCTKTYTGFMALLTHSLQKHPKNSIVNDLHEQGIEPLNDMTLQDSDGSYEFVKMEHFLNIPEEKKRWNLALNRDEDAEVVVNFGYSNHRNYGKVHHWMAYMYRYEVWDMFKFMIRQGGIVENREVAENHPLRLVMFNPDSSTIREILTRRKNRVTWAGWLAPAKRHYILSSLGIHIKIATLRKEKELKAKNCPYKHSDGSTCGAPLVKIDPNHYKLYKAGLLPWEQVAIIQNEN